MEFQKKEMFDTLRHESEALRFSLGEALDALGRKAEVVLSHFGERGVNVASGADARRNPQTSGSAFASGASRGSAHLRGLRHMGESSRKRQGRSNRTCDDRAVGHVLRDGLPGC